MRSLLPAVFLAISFQAFASEDDPCRENPHLCEPHDDGGVVTVDQGQDQSQDQGQDQSQDQGQDQSQSQDMVGGSQSVNLNQTYDSRRVPPIFLYQANQVEACGRVFGFSGANTSGGWAFGIPIPRSWTPTCDLWKAAEEAQENGFIWLSYAFQCSIKTVRRTMGNNTCANIERAAEVELMAAMPNFPSALLPDLSGLYDQAAQYEPRYEEHSGHEGHEEHLMADVTQEEYDAQQESLIEQQELVEERQTQQQNLIETLEQERAADKVEIDRLRQEQDNRAEQRAQAVVDLLGLKSAVYSQQEEPPPPQEVEPPNE